MGVFGVLPGLGKPGIVFAIGDARTFERLVPPGRERPDACAGWRAGLVAGRKETIIDVIMS